MTCTTGLREAAGVSYKAEVQCASPVTVLGHVVLSVLYSLTKAGRCSYPFIGEETEAQGLWQFPEVHEE